MNLYDLFGFDDPNPKPESGPLSLAQLFGLEPLPGLPSSVPTSEFGVSGNELNTGPGPLWKDEREDEGNLMRLARELGAGVLEAGDFLATEPLEAQERFKGSAARWLGDKVGDNAVGDALRALGSQPDRVAEVAGGWGDALTDAAAAMGTEKRPFSQDVKDRPVMAVLERAVRSAPMTAALAAEYAIPVAGPLVAGAHAGLAEASSAFNERTERGDDFLRAASTSAAQGIVVAGLERIGLDSIFGKATLRSLRTGGVKSFLQLGEAFVGEGVTESAQEATAMLYDWASTGDPEQLLESFADGWSRLGESFLVGGVTGGGISAGRQVAQRVFSRNPQDSGGGEPAPTPNLSDAQAAASIASPELTLQFDPVAAEFGQLSSFYRKQAEAEAAAQGLVPESANYTETVAGLHHEEMREVNAAFHERFRKLAEGGLEEARAYADLTAPYLAEPAEAPENPAPVVEGSIPPRKGYEPPTLVTTMVRDKLRAIAQTSPALNEHAIDLTMLYLEARAAADSSVASVDDLILRDIADIKAGDQAAHDSLVKVLKQNGALAQLAEPDLAEFAEMARRSMEIGQSRAASAYASEVMEEPGEGVTQRLVALDQAGNELGSMTYTIEPGGGFRVQDVATGVRGSGGMRAMMNRAAEVSGGTYQGSFAETSEGEGALARLRETDPHLFPQAGPGDSPAIKGAVEWLTDARAVVTLFPEADISTVIHEFSHIWRRQLGSDDLAKAARWAGAKNDNWTPSAEEKFARGMELYLRQGRAPAAELEPLFARLQEAMMTIYQGVKGSPIDVRISPQMRTVYDALLTPQAPVKPKRKAKKKTGKAQPQVLAQEADTREEAHEFPIDPYIKTLRRKVSDIYSSDGILDFTKRSYMMLYEELVSKDARLEKIAKRLGGREFMNLVATARGAAEAARGPVVRGTVLWDDAVKGYVRTGDSLSTIAKHWTSEHKRDLSRLMDSERQIELHDRQLENANEYERRRTEHAAWVKGGRKGKAPLKPSRKSHLDVDPRRTADAIKTRAMLRAKYGKSFAWLEQQAGSVREWAVRSTLDPLREVGVLSEQQYNDVLEKNQKYAPFFRVLDEAEEAIARMSPGRRNPLHAISGDIGKGGGVLDPLEALVLRAQDIHVFVTRQRIRNKLGELADNHPELSQEVSRKKGANLPSQVEGRNVFYRFQDGNRIAYEAHPDLLATLENLSPKQWPALVRMATAPTRWLRTGATLGLSFITRNPLRDQSTAAFHSRYGYTPYLDMLRGAVHALTGSETYREMLDNGGALATMVSVDQSTAPTEVDSLGKATKGKEKALRGWREFKRHGYLLGPLRLLSSSFEMATRTGAYAKAKAKGASPLDAAAEARDIILDFGRAGNTGRLMNQMYAFLNAEIQDVDKFARTISDPKQRLRSAANAMAWIVTPALLNYFWNRDNEEYQNLPAWDRMMFYHTQLPNGWFVRWPRPVGILNAVFGVGSESVARYLDKKDPKAFKTLVSAFAEQTPINHLTSVAGIIPTPLEPLVEANIDKWGYDTFREAPIVPIWDRQLPEFQGEGRLGPTVQLLGAMTGASPYKWQHIIKGYGATIASYGLAATDAALGGRPLPTDEARPDATTAVLDELGLTSKRPIGFASQPARDFYALWEEADIAKESLDKNADDGEAVLKIMKEHPETAAYQYLQKTRTRLSELSKLRREALRIQDDPIARADMLRGIDEEVTQLSKLTLDVVADYLRKKG